MVFKSEYDDVEPDSRFKNLLNNFYWHQLDVFKDRVLFVDLVSKRQWTGAQIKQISAHLASKLIRTCHLEPNSDCVTFYKNCDHLQLVSLALLFAGASVCAGEPADPEQEHTHMLELMKPALVFISWQHIDEMRRIRQRSELNFNLVLIDDDQLSGERFEQLSQEERTGNCLFGYHKHLYTDDDSNMEQHEQLPVQVHPDRPAYVLLTSGSTGRPKPVGRSQRNSLYVCHSLNERAGRELWHMDKNSVLAGHLQLDHGTGTFSTKMTLAKGLKLILMHGYEYASMLDAIQSYAISDICLGSALLHNFLATALEDNTTANLSSLRNILAVGSPISSQELVKSFMKRWPECSIRQAYGMTECGFVAVMRRQDGDTEAVGSLLPNLEIKLMARDGEGQLSSSSREITEFHEEGELFIRGPTVSPGYLGAQFVEQSRSSFLPDGFYKTNDICQLIGPGQLKVRGRFSEILCLHDGWKVLPSEIEQIIVSHPLVKEASVIGIPHPELPTCHAPRAYVVPKDNVQVQYDDLKEPSGSLNLNFKAHSAQDGKENMTKLSKQALFDYTAARMSEPKHLIGGIRIIRELPRISIGKVDKKLLRQLDCEVEK